MSVLEALASPSKMRRFAQVALFLPAIISTHEIVEAKMDGFSPAEKRAAVIGLLERLVEQLAQRGYVPPDLEDGLHLVIGDLYDSVAKAVKG